MKFLPFSFSSLLLLLLLALPGCEKKAPEEAKISVITSKSTKSADINLRAAKLAVIPEDYDKWINITFSADGQQVFYGAVKQGKNFVVIGNDPGKNYEDASFMVQSADGSRFAFGGVTGGKKRLVVDNKELKGLYHEEVAPASFSPDGRFVACEVGGLKEKKWFILVSDGEKEIYRSRIYRDTWRQPVFSPDGRLLVFELGDDKGKKGSKKSTVFFLDVSAGKIVKEQLYTDYHVGSFSFNSDSSKVIYDIHKEGKNFLVLQDFSLHEERKAEFTYAASGKYMLSPDGTHILSIATRDGKQYLVLSSWESPAQGKESGPYEAIASPVFGPDPETVVYHAMRDGKWRTVVGDAEGPEYYGVVNDVPVFSPDGDRIAYPAMKDFGGGHRDRRSMMDGKWVMVVSRMGKPDVVTEGPVYDMVVTPVFSPDGRRIAYRARKGTMEKARRFIVIADAETGKVIEEGPVGDEIWPPVWSADGKAAAYGARHGRELWWRVEAVE